jgi:putative ABC transport system permease protein
MISNFIKVKSRNYLKHKSQFITEVTGLALALSCFLLIQFYVQHERSYDDFHEHSATTFRLSGAWGEEMKRTAIIPSQWPGEIVENFPEIKHYTRVRKMLRFSPLVSFSGKGFYESNFISADSTFFDIFSFELIEGDKNTALDDPNVIILTESKAHKIFGRTDVLGNTITLDNQRSYKITGVLRDLPTNSHLHFDFILPIETVPPGAMVYSYFKLNDNVDLKALESNISVFLKERFPPSNATKQFKPEFQHLQAIHLLSDLEYEFEPKGNETYLDLLQLIAVIVIVISIFNFVNLALASGSLRIKEYAVRKALGAIKQNLVAQFIAEAIFTMILTLIVTTGLLILTFPAFTNTVRIQVDIPDFVRQNLFLILSLIFFIGIICGLLPAMILLSKRSGISPVGKFSSGGKGRSQFRTVLVGIQLIASFILITSTILIFDQLSFLRNKELGFNKEQVIILNARALRDSVQAKESLKSEFYAVPKVSSVSMTQTVPGDFNNMANISYTIEGRSEPVVMRTIFIDHDFISTLGIDLIEGRNFDSSIASDTMAYIINEAAVRNWETVAPLNSRLESSIGDKVKGPVIGIAENFHFASLHNDIEPLVLAILPDAFNKIIIRVDDAEDLKSTLANLENRWKVVFPDYPFHYEFLDQMFNALYQNDDRFSIIFSAFTFVAVFLSCLGLYGMISMDTNKKAREIGVRKVFGASNYSIIVLLLRHVLKTSFLAVIIGIPLSYWLMNKWLQNFSYAVQFSYQTVLTGGCLIICISTLTSFLIVVRSATANPIQTLKTE